MASGPPPPLPSNPAENEGPIILGATLTVTALALITMITRLYVRFGIIRNFGWDDALMTFAMAISAAGQGVIIPQVRYGAGRHMGDIPPPDISMGLKLNFVTQPMYLVAICVVKLAIGASLLRIASTKFYKYTIISIMGFMAFYTVGCFFTIMFQCTDIRVLWDPTVPSVCWSKETLQSLSYTNVTLNILTDLAFAIVIPTPMLWSLNVTKRTRYSLMAILGLGVFACAAAFIKVGYLVNYGKLGDWLWDSRNITIWTVVETNIGIVGGSLPTIRPLVKNFLGSVYGKGSRKTGPSAYYAGPNSIKGSKNWQSLSSGRRPGVDPTDETSSERAFNENGDYEMGDRRKTKTNVITTAVEAKASDESLDRSGMPRVTSGGITKTTTMNMTFLDLKSDDPRSIGRGV